ncbi:MAG TPA: crotonase/enoyl-CoA hydratase family protein [Burkholderiaceae bacterium]|nr:crotonase/enoyl-CoA hydratase family protein [Burkholderiaceae bacterium]
MTVSSERKGAVVTVVIERPDAKNAVDGPTAEALAQALRDFDADADASVAVLAGAGGTFCAGADLKAFGAALAGRANPLHDDMARTAPMGPSRLKLSKPVIAAVDGFAVAGGMELALWCDLRVMEETAVFGIFCRRWGVPLIDGGTVRLPRLIGMSHALDLILTGRPVHAREALSIGLANRIAPAGEARTHAQALAAAIARFPQVCLRNDRASVLEQDGLTLEAALANEFRRGRATLASGEARAGAEQFARGAGRGGRFDA